VALGIKNLDLFNHALLSKWKWRRLVVTDNPWDKLMEFRHDVKVSNNVGSLW
jgi:hypothetical protein